MYYPAIGDKVVYEPTGKIGIVRGMPDEHDYCFVVYDRPDEAASLQSDWTAQRTNIDALAKR